MKYSIYVSSKDMVWSQIYDIFPHDNITTPSTQNTNLPMNMHLFEKNKVRYNIKLNVGVINK